MFNKNQIRIKTVLWGTDISALYLISYLNPCPLLLIQFAYCSEAERNRSEPLGRVTNTECMIFVHNWKIYYPNVYVLHFFLCMSKEKISFWINPFSTKIFSLYCIFIIIVGCSHKQTIDVKQTDFWWVWSIFHRKTKTKWKKLTLELKMRSK